jgi:hypothetical protein
MSTFLAPAYNNDGRERHRHGADEPMRHDGTADGGGSGDAVVGAAGQCCASSSAGAGRLAAAPAPGGPAARPRPGARGSGGWWRSPGAAVAKLRAHGDLLMAPREGGRALEGASLDMVYSLGVLHRLNGSARTAYSDFAVANLMHVCASPDICKACCDEKGCNCTAAEANGGNNAAARHASLCTGSLGQSLGIAYDWFYHAMAPPQRAVLRQAIVTQVLNVFAEGLSAGFVGSVWWHTGGNFNGCIDGGAFIAALAVLDEPGDATPEHVPGSTIAQFARDALQLAVTGMLRLEGGVSIFREGYDYGSFGFGSYLQAVRAAETALGPNSSIARALAPTHPELKRNRLYNIGSSGLQYNWADSSACGDADGTGCYFGANTNEWQAMAMARRNADKALAYVARRRALDPRSPCEPEDGAHGEKGHLKFDCALAVLEWTDIGFASDLADVPLGIRYNYTQTAFLRSSWGSDGSWLAFKGGNNQLQQLGKATTHTHADQGSFVFDQLGLRWASDLGNVAAGGYDSKGYFAMQKFDLFGPSTMQHNTLTFGELGQDACTAVGDPLPALFDTVKTPVKQATTCTAPVEQFSLSKQFGVVDLRTSYSLSAPGAAMRRGLAMLPQHGHGMLVADEGATTAHNSSLEMHWHLHTFANVTLGTNVAKLTIMPHAGNHPLHNGAPESIEVVQVSRATCPDARLSVSEVVNSADRSAHGWKDLGMRRLTITTPVHRCERLCVVIGAGAGAWAGGLSVHPLSQWPVRGPTTTAPA